MRNALLIGLCLLSQSAWAAAPPDPFPEVAHSYLVEIDGRVVWEKKPHTPLPLASLTKMMTALLLLEQGQLNDVQRVSLAVTQETGSRLGLKLGERLLVKDLLAATLIQSANDACHALAEHHSGSEAVFVQQMNQRAQALGLRDTHFQNACGHDAPHHHSSARDLARLAHELLKHEPVIALTSQSHLTITTLTGQPYSVTTKNALIGRYRGALGLKTGYTANAGKCLVAYAKRDSHQVLLVMLHGHDRWWDAVDLLDMAFDYARTTQ